MRDFLQSELDKCLEVKNLIDQVKQLESNELRALSSRIDHDSNKRDIITIPPPPPPPPRAPGIISPYLSKVSVPSDQGPQSSRKRSSNDPSIRKASVQGSIIEIRGSQVAKERYDQIQNMGNALTNQEQADYEIDDGQTNKTMNRDVELQNPLNDSENNYGENL